MKNIRLTKHYYVDEAGDPVLFDRRGKTIIGNEGCSRFFILGLSHVEDHATLKSELDNLRNELCNDPYFSGVPSMRIQAGKTATQFHAKDDPPEIRWKVFSLLIKQEINFYAVVRDKTAVLEYVRQRNQRDPEYRYNHNELYDYMTRCLFRDLLHKADEFNICFSQRGKSDRNNALRSALLAARNTFLKRRGIACSSPLNITVCPPEKLAGLQATDYILWALQRMYERKEERYLNYVRPLIRLIRDIDDARRARYGEYYTRENPLTLEKLKPGI